ncbi:ATP-binding protein [Actinokineospora enzanensis]|uniref:ATP-binding protein n=1 Tax=Actinokineospora enzanensis TaxID=155975 RepID=UPI00035CAA86|nr:ATP-binding protein [Actinokineospora enzanensis]
MTESGEHTTGGGFVPGYLPLRGLPGMAPVGERVEMRVTAHLANLPVVRSVAGTVAAMLDLDLDAISDLTLAVDEVCSTLIGLAAPGAQVTCEFVHGPATVGFEASVPAVDGGGADPESFGWQVLAALVDRVTHDVRPDAEGRPVARIAVSRARTAGGG